MCGIVGLVDLQKQYNEGELEMLVTAMRDQFVHRGPDDAGVWIDAAAGCALGHRRLSIIDLSPEGRQPMGAQGVDTVVTYNGEIYNFQKFRQRLLAQGATFRSQSDTEILPYLFKDLAPDALGLLSGMFAFGVWHKEREELLLARDAFGKKPLYIYQDEHVFAFASEMQAFYALPSFDATVDDDAIAEYLLLGYCPGPKTIYRSVRLLDPGTFERISFKSGVRTEAGGKFFEFSALTRPSVSEIDKDVLKARLKDSLIEAVEQRMISDVPLGAFLSGGVDSSLVVAVVRKELGKDINTYSIGFEGSAESEHEDARAIATHLGANHHDAMVKPDGIDMIYKIASVLDQPNGDSSCLPTYLLSEFTRRHVTVALSGDGGDELFGGYGRYRDTMNEVDDLDLRRRVHGHVADSMTTADMYMSLRWHIWLPDQVRKMRGGELPDATRERLASWRRIMEDDKVPVMHRMRTLDANLYMHGAVLAKVDRMSMQHSLEVRCPLLDVQFSEIAMGLSESDCWATPNVTKKILKDIACDYLPHEWMHRSKKGFGLPANAWAQEDVLNLSKELIGSNDAYLASHLDAKALRATIANQSRPDHFSIYQMWPLMMLELWLREQPKKIAQAAKLTRSLSSAKIKASTSPEPQPKTKLSRFFNKGS